MDRRKPGDWDCSACTHFNFSFRDSCQKCGAPKPGGMGGAGGGFGGGGFGGGMGGNSFGGAGMGAYGGGMGGMGGMGAMGGMGGMGGMGAGGMGGGGMGGGYGGAPGMQNFRAGDWMCTSPSGCGAHNFASRSTCFKCGFMREAGGMGAVGMGGGMGPGGGMGGGFGGGGGGFGASRNFKPGDWMCTRDGCNVHNFASRSVCYRCNAPRQEGS
eukprot:jgi/Mesvir1/29254/Mv25850-RA.1